MTALVRPAASLWWRELVRFGRDRPRAASTLATALLFWLLIGFGLGESFVPAGLGDVGAVEYLYPGTVLFVVLLTAIVATFSLIEDRREGFLQGVVVAPIPRSAIVLGKVLGGTTIGLLQAAILVPLAPLVGVATTPAGVGLSLVALAVTAFGLTALGFVLAWRMDSIAGFHGIVNLILMPMWFLSGAIFPIEGAAPWLEAVMRANPVAYGLAAFRGALYAGSEGVGWVGAGTAWGVTIGFAAVAFVVAARLARR